MIASTTENPYFYVYNAVISRCTVFEIKSVTPEDVEKAVIRASTFSPRRTVCSTCRKRA